MRQHEFMFEDQPQNHRANTSGIAFSKRTKARKKVMVTNTSTARQGKSNQGKSNKEYSDEWYTPDAIPAALGNFHMNPCAGPANHAKINIRRPDCGLAVEWEGRVWLNPPFSDPFPWIEKIIQHGDGVIFLPFRPKSVWFQKVMPTADLILLLRGDTYFGRPDGTKSHIYSGLALLSYGAGATEALRNCGLPGVLITVCANR